MSADVIDLAERRPDEYVWQCLCKSTAFQLHQDGRVECCGCETIQNTGNGTWMIPEPREAEVTAFPVKSELTQTD